VVLLFAEAEPDPEPFNAASCPATVPELTESTPLVTVPAKPTFPLALPLRPSTEPLPDPLADPDTALVTLFAILAGAPMLPFNTAPAFPTASSVLPTDPAPFSVPPTVPPSAPLMLPRSCACAGIAASASAETANVRIFFIVVLL
jgi:hypothetical protein